MCGLIIEVVNKNTGRHHITQTQLKQLRALVGVFVCSLCFFFKKKGGQVWKCGYLIVLKNNKTAGDY